MSSLYIDYTQEFSRKLLFKKFGYHKDFIRRIDELSICYLCALACLCDGKTISTTGNNIKADYYITRASAVMQFLRKKYAIPVSRKLLVTVTASGSKAKQALFYICPRDMTAFLKNPCKQLKEIKKELEASSEIKAKRTLYSLIERYGVDWVIKVIEECQS